MLEDAPRVLQRVAQSALSGHADDAQARIARRDLAGQNRPICLSHHMRLIESRSDTVQQGGIINLSMRHDWLALAANEFCLIQLPAPNLMSRNISVNAAPAVQGIGLMVAAVLCFSLIDAITKYISAFTPVLFILWGRYLFQNLFLVVLLVRAGSFGFLRTKRFGLQAVRAGLSIATSFFFVFGLLVLPLADAVALYMVGPLFMTALSAPLLRERVGMRRWLAVGAGFIGALIIVRPGMGDAFNWASLLMLLAALVNALFQITTRKLSNTEHPLTLLSYLTFTGLIATSAVVPFYWINAPIGTWALLAAQGILSNAGNLCLIAALRQTPASTLAPFNYGTIAFATIIGYFVFNQFPDQWTVTGTLVIVGSGLYVFHREAINRRKRLAT